MAAKQVNDAETANISPEQESIQSDSDLVVFASSRAVIEGRLTPATIIISKTTGKITAIHDSVLGRTSFPADATYNDYTPHVLLPGLVDAHVHLNEPGRTEWEGFYTGTQAAAFGGVTTVIDMPLNAIPPTTTMQGLKEKVAAAQGKCWVDVGFYGGIIPGNAAELKPLVRAGVRGFKGFLIDSGVEEFPAVSAEDITKVFGELADEPTTVMFHAEMIPPITQSVGDDVQTSRPPAQPSGPLEKYQTFLDSRPAAFETCAISQIVHLAPLAPHLPLHIVHLSAVEAIPILRDARARGIRITAETCFHYLSLAAEDVPDGDTRHKCCPPIRSESNQEGLWRELLAGEEGGGVISTVVSDHSPCTPDLKLLPAHVPGAVVASSSSGGGKTAASSCGAKKDDKTGDFFGAWGGISSVGLGLSILWTESQRRHLEGSKTLLDIARWCCKNTASQVGLEGRKGEFRVGLDGDVCVFDPEASFVVEPHTMLFRNKCSPYEGRLLKGVAVETWLRGRRIHSRSGGFGDGTVPTGELLLEPRRKPSPS
jgi:allantoinase